MRQLQSYSSLPLSGGEGSLSPLARKLRLKAEQKIAVLNAPPAYLASLQPAPPDLHRELKAGELYDAVQLFVISVEELRTMGAPAVRAVKPDGLLWVAYPKGGSTRGATDLPATPWWTKRDVLGEITGETGYKPVAFVKIDETWTALRFKRG